MPEGHTIVYSPFLFSATSLEIKDSSKLRLLQARTMWLPAMKDSIQPIIAVAVFIDIGVCFVLFSFFYLANSIASEAGNSLPTSIGKSQT